MRIPYYSTETQLHISHKFRLLEKKAGLQSNSRRVLVVIVVPDVLPLIVVLGALLVTWKAHILSEKCST